MEPRRLSKREKYILYFCVAFIFLVFIYNFTTEQSLFKKWFRLNSEIALKEKKLDKNLRILAQKETIKTQYEKFADYMKKSGTDEEEMAVLLREIETLASKCLVKIGNIRPLPVEGAEFYSKYSVEVRSEAGIENLAKFIYELESSSYGLQIERLRLNFTSEESASSTNHILITRILFL